MTRNQIKNKRRQGTEIGSYPRTRMQKEKIIEALKKQGFRITKQRLTILDIILENECSCCKEIYFKASRIDNKIGTATVYRTVNTLEEIGIINRKNMYKIAYAENCKMENACTVLLEDDTIYQLSAQKWNLVLKQGLSACGYLTNQNIKSVIMSGCECEDGVCK